MRDTGWFKSSHSAAASNACVQVRLTARTAQIRDSTRSQAGRLTVTPTTWTTFLTLTRRR